MSEPSPGEIMRRLDDVSRQLVTLAEQLRSDRIDAAATYVRKDVYDANYRAGMQRLEDVERDSSDKDKAADAFRRQILLTLIGFALPLLGTLLLAINNFLSGGAP